MVRPSGRPRSCYRKEKSNDRKKEEVGFDNEISDPEEPVTYVDVAAPGDEKRPSDHGLLILERKPARAALVDAGRERDKAIGTQ